MIIHISTTRGQCPPFNQHNIDQAPVIIFDAVASIGDRARYIERLHEMISGYWDVQG
ncbi:hypothetical protein ACFLY0_00645 [Patescibacteria group bacterium]